ncbi:hypothetical protein WCX72_08410 [Sulfurimonas sp. HSL1-6]|uniref:hypothetical protein n=1 Tax=Thiomicrolovo immobilis TaxID=3131935 RepID=UPI0031F98058
MKKFNLVKEIISVDKPAMMAAVNGGKPFGITMKGEIQYPPYDARSCYLFQGSVARPAPSALMPTQPKSLAELLGGNMQVVEVEDRILIKAARNWQEIIGYNVRHADYDDTTGDGVAEFTDSELEEIGWQATEFGINYRELVELIEAQCDGTLFCIENEGENYHFSGMGFIDDMDCARKQCFDYCVKRIETLLREDESYHGAVLSGDEEEALAFFGVTVPDSAVE